MTALKYVFVLFSCLLLVGCSETAPPATTQGDSNAIEVLPEEQLAQAISAMKNWTSYSTQYHYSAIEHPELDAYSSETTLSYVQEPFQVAKRYEDNYFGGHFESYYSPDAGFSVKNYYGDGAWQAVEETVTNNEPTKAMAALLQLLLQEQNSISYQDNTAQLTITDGNFQTIVQQIEQLDALYRKLATPQDILVNIYDEEYESERLVEQLDATISFKNNQITGYAISAVLDVGFGKDKPGQLEITETFSSVNALTEIAAPTN